MLKPTQRNPQFEVLVVGQTPPPYHGQAIMIGRIVNADMPTINVHHVRMAFSQSMDDVGRFQPSKVFHLIAVIWQVWYARWALGIRILLYPPAGPDRIPMWRDIIFLLSTRWMFDSTIFHMQASGISEIYPKLNRLTRWLFEKAYFYPDAIIRLSTLTPEDGKALKAKAEFILPNCSDDDYVKFQKPRDNNRCRILYLGTVCETKGILDLLAACDRLQRDEVPFHLDVVGSFQPDRFEKTVRRKINELALADNVTLRGQLTGDDKFRALARADLFCFPSFYPCEAFPLVIVEAMCFELPVVATRWRGIPSIVDHGETGYLTEIHDVDRMAGHLRMLIEDQALRLSIGKNARKKFSGEYTTGTYIAKMDALLNEVAGSSAVQAVASS